MSGVERPGDLSSFLRSRRARLRPGAVGLPEHGRRRAEGLRREEVAALAGMSIDYYARLEQGRDRRPSPDVLAAIGRALQMSDDERAHLFRLAGYQPPNSTHPENGVVRRTTRAVVDALHPLPAYLLTVALDVVAWNAAAQALLADFQAVPSTERNILWLSFMDPSLRGRWPDWEMTAGDLVATLRGELGRHPDHPDIIRLVTRLSAASPEFARWWGRHDIATLCGADRRLLHPQVGELHLFCEQMSVPPANQRLITFLPVDTASEARLRLLTGAVPADAVPRGATLTAGGRQSPDSRPLRLVR
jgi:transcriptional regulator with XRE-family HTH domain